MREQAAEKSALMFELLLSHAHFSMNVVAASGDASLVS